MRIVIIGQAAFGSDVLDRLTDKGENIAGVYAPPDSPGGREDPLKKNAQESGIKTFQPATYKDDSVFNEYRDLNPDLTVMAFVTDIIPGRFFELPAHGAICYHPSLLPRHRGASAINWAVIMGDTRTGLSIFWADDGIDTGPVLLQKEIGIGPDDTTGSLYFNQLYPMGIDAIIESVDLIKKGNPPRLVQDESLATYEPPCDDRVAGIDWQKPAGDVYNLIRGCDPQPGAYSRLKGEMVRFYTAGLIEGPGNEKPGTVLGIDDRGISIAVLGGKIIAGKVRTKKSGKVPAAECAANENIMVGDIFGT